MWNFEEFQISLLEICLRFLLWRQTRPPGKSRTRGKGLRDMRESRFSDVVTGFTSESQIRPSIQL
ncbi:hypothetical protein BT96DRAFT_1026360 [Gymnopus androsaceus JB14]|uniref:Uncharacterized protein n=1 Tax=Gymnopus androsaceus JB14 TaxID=1447944 RepID=A0A6A4GKF3_9AGAR|nr:hypothetical protein BT96DRAFT_1026360 [Gymnopus androsaceus JB14]